MAKADTHFKGEAASAAPANDNRPQAEAVRTVGKHQLVFADDIDPDIWEPGLIDGILDTAALTIVYGPSGCGKTANVVDIACSIAAGIPWREHQTKQGPVLYFAAEQPRSTKRRIWAWKQVHGIEALPLVVCQSPVQLDLHSKTQIDKDIECVTEHYQQTPVLVVLDTLARTNPGDENSTKDMSAYVGFAECIRDKINGHVLIVHHTGKDDTRGARGSSALKAATDHELELYKDAERRGYGGIQLTKIREGGMEGAVFGYCLEPFYLGENKLGRQVSTVVAMPAEAPKKKADETAEKEKYILGVLGEETMSIKQLVDAMDCSQVSDSPVPKNQRTVAYSIIRKMLAKGKLYGAEAQLQAAPQKNRSVIGKQSAISKQLPSRQVAGDGKQAISPVGGLPDCLACPAEIFVHKMLYEAGYMTTKELNRRAKEAGIDHKTLRQITETMKKEGSIIFEKSGDEWEMAYAGCGEPIRV
jgi:AAA domain